jgi:presenilin-like A22 family membrane protease
LGNALYFVILTGVGATIMLTLLKRKNRKLVTSLVGFALTTAVFMLSIIYLYAAMSFFDIPYVDIMVLAISILLTVSADYAIFRAPSRIMNLTIVLLGGALGTFLGFSIPVLSAILILGFLAVYDVFAVYYGPVGKIAQSGLEQLRGLSFSFKDVQMGLGDLIFYSMLTSQVFIAGGLMFCLASLTGILVGAFGVFKMLEKRGMFPGLPFPIVLGLIPLVISFLL